MLIGYIDTPLGREARVRVDGETTPRNVAVFAISPLRRASRWWWPDSYSGRVALVGIVVAVVAAVPSYFAWFAGAGGSGSLSATGSSAATKPAAAGATTPLISVSLSGTLKVFNTAFGKTWGTEIDADATDKLRFLLDLRNDGSKTTPDLAIDPVLIRPTDMSRPWIVRIAAGPPGDLRLVDGPEVMLRPQSNGFNRLSDDNYHATIGKLGSRSLALVQGGVNLNSLPRDSWEISPYPHYLGSLGAHETAVIRFTGAISYPSEAPQLESGSVIRFKRIGKDTRFVTTGSTEPGDILQVRIRLNNPTWAPSPLHLRVSIRAHSSQGFVTIDAYGQFPDLKEQHIGQAIMNASGAPAIALAVMPGSTTIFSYDGPNCNQLNAPGSLPDGIQEGGIDVGPVGGFRPRDPCDASEFTRYVDFSAKVSRAADH